MNVLPVVQLSSVEPQKISCEGCPERKVAKKKKKEYYRIDFTIPSQGSVDRLESLVSQFASLDISCTMRTQKSLEKKIQVPPCTRGESLDSQLDKLVEQIKKVASFSMISEDEREVIEVTFNKQLLWTDSVNKKEVFREARPVFDAIRAKMPRYEAIAFRHCLQKAEKLLEELYP